jgi:hypothetical protein
LIFQIVALHATLLISLESSQWVSRGALTWFETVWSYGVKVIDYWTIFSMKTKQNWNWKLYWNLGEFLLLLESPQQVRFNRVYFTTFRDKVWKILIFDWILLLKTGFGRKNQLSPQCVHIYIYIYVYIYWKCVHTWANGTGYTKYTLKLNWIPKISLKIKNKAVSELVLEIFAGFQAFTWKTCPLALGYCSWKQHLKQGSQDPDKGLFSSVNRFRFREPFLHKGYHHHLGQTLFLHPERTLEHQQLLTREKKQKFHCWIA